MGRHRPDQQAAETELRVDPIGNRQRGARNENPRRIFSVPSAPSAMKSDIGDSHRAAESRRSSCTWLFRRSIRAWVPLVVFYQCSDPGGEDTGRRLPVAPEIIGQLGPPASPASSVPDGWSWSPGHAMVQRDADRNLLFGILALQMDFIGREALIAGMNAWVFEKDKPLGAILAGQGALAADKHSLLEELVRAHVRQHADDTTRPGARARPQASGPWPCASCSAASSTSATPSRTRTAGACCIATSSRPTSSSASTARRWSSTGAWPSRSTGPARARPPRSRRCGPPRPAGRPRRCPGRPSARRAL